MRLSSKIKSIEASDLAKVNKAAKDLEAQGKKIIHLERGEPDFDTPKFISEAAYKAMLDGFTHYPNLQGEIPLRKALAEKLNNENRIPCGIENIAVVNGGMHGLYGALQCICEPGDEVLILTPYWLSISKLVFLTNGGVPKYMPYYLKVKEENLPPERFREELLANLTPRTIAVYINSPNNPSGVAIPDSHLEVIAAVAKEKDLIVISDEAYEHIIFDGLKHRSIASLEGMAERTISVFAFSKSYAMTGWRLGYVVGPADFIALLWAKMILYTSNGIATPIQVAGVAALKSGAGDIARMNKDYERRRDVFVNGLNSVKGLRCIVPDGAFYAFCDLSGIMNGKTISDMVNEFLSIGIACATGTAFGSEYKTYVRFCFAASEEELKETVRILREKYGAR